MTSPGIRSGVNWMRLVSSPSARLSVRTSRVFATPGTPSSSTWPRGEQGDEQPGDGAVLADDGLADLGAHAVHRLAQRRVVGCVRRWRERRSWACSFRVGAASRARRPRGGAGVLRRRVPTRSTIASLRGRRRSGCRATDAAVDAGAGAAASAISSSRTPTRAEAEQRGRCGRARRCGAGRRHGAASRDCGVQPRAPLGRLATRAPSPADARRRAGRSGGRARCAAAMPATSSSTMTGLTHGGVSSPSVGSPSARSVSAEAGHVPDDERMPPQQVHRERGVAVLGEVLVREQRACRRRPTARPSVRRSPTRRPRPPPAG